MYVERHMRGLSAPTADRITYDEELHSYRRPQHLKAVDQGEPYASQDQMMRHARQSWGNEGKIETFSVVSDHVERDCQCARNEGPWPAWGGAFGLG